MPSFKKPDSTRTSDRFGVFADVRSGGRGSVDFELGLDGIVGTSARTAAIVLEELAGASSSINGIDLNGFAGASVSTDDTECFREELVVAVG